MPPGDDDVIVVGGLLDGPDRFADVRKDDRVGVGEVRRVGELGPVVDDRDGEIEEPAQPGDGLSDMARPGDDQSRQGPDVLGVDVSAQAPLISMPAGVFLSLKPGRTAGRSPLSIQSRFTATRSPSTGSIPAAR